MRYVFLFIAVLSLSACAAYGTKVDQDKLSQFVKGKTTYAEVVRELGKPTQNTINADGSRTIMYVYGQSQAKAESFIPFVGGFLGGATSENTTVTLNFDTKNILVSYTASEGSAEMGTGLTSGRKQ
jgi:outer membrane protein assembly factor BamE (lipoprotein component of BamABCDE complex)